MHAEPLVRAVRAFGNNVVLATDGQHEVVLVGRGIGFGVRAGAVIREEAIEQRFVPHERERADAIAALVQERPIAFVETARAIVDVAVRELGVAERPGFVLAVLDHVHFAAERVAAGTVVDMPLRDEVARLYPAEAAVGEHAVALVRDRLGVELPADEWVAFALHCVNQQWRSADIGRTVAMTETLQWIFDELASRWHHRVPEHGRDAIRFVTHVRYLFRRVADHAQATESNLHLLETIGRAYPGVVVAARDIAVRIGEAVHRELSQSEVEFLAVHLGRLYEATVAEHGTRGE